MLQSIRDRAKGWFAWLIVGFISIPFALWGIQEYLGMGKEPVVAMVNGSDITDRQLQQRFYNYKEQLKQTLGQSYRPDLFDDDALKSNVLSGMIKEELQLQASHEMGLQVSNNQVTDFIKNMPRFSVVGNFSFDVYQREITTQGYSEAGYEEKVRSVLISRQLRDALISSEVFMQNEADEMARLSAQSRDVELYTVLSTDYLADIEISEAEIKTYFDANQALYMAAEKVKLEYVEYKIADLSSEMEVTEGEIKAHYEANIEALRSTEKRQASHILLTLEEGVDESGLDEKANSLLSRIQAGEDFSDLAKEFSKDGATADNGGDLGLSAKGSLGSDVLDDAIFGMTVNQVKIVASDFGLHILQLHEIKAPEIELLDDVKDTIRLTLQEEKAGKAFFDKVELLKEQSYEESGSLEPAATSMGAEVQTTDWLSRGSGEGLFASPAVEAQAFNEDVLDAGNNSEVIELSSNHVVVIRVSSHQEVAPRELSEVTAEIEAALKQEKATLLAKEAGEKLLAQLGKGQVLGDIVVKEDIVLHDGLTRDSVAMNRSLLQHVFQLKHPDAEAVNSGLGLDNGDYALIVLQKVNVAELPDKASGEQSSLVDRASQQKGNSYFEHLLENLQSTGDILVTQSSSDD